MPYGHKTFHELMMEFSEPEVETDRQSTDEVEVVSRHAHQEYQAWHDAWSKVTSWELSSRMILDGYLRGLDAFWRKESELVIPGIQVTAFRDLKAGDRVTAQHPSGLTMNQCLFVGRWKKHATNLPILGLVVEDALTAQSVRITRVGL
jgi:hypothetical protein